MQESVQCRLDEGPRQMSATPVDYYCTNDNSKQQMRQLHTQQQQQWQLILLD